MAARRFLLLDLSFLHSPSLPSDRPPLPYPFAPPLARSPAVSFLLPLPFSPPPAYLPLLLFLSSSTSFSPSASFPSVVQAAQQQSSWVV
jgi:hypothetical protein